MKRLTSFVLPTLNEDLPRALQQLDEVLAPLEGDFEVLFVDDSAPAWLEGERAKLARTPSKARARVVEGPRIGKGAAVRCGVLETRGSIVFTMDADLPIPLENIGPFIRLLDGGADVAMAERPLNREFDTWLRWLVSRSLLVIQRAFVFQSSEFSDTQCGFKAFQGDLARAIARGQIIDGGMYDLEYIVEARRRNATIRPITIVPNAETRPSRIDVWKCLRHDWLDVVRVRIKPAPRGMPPRRAESLERDLGDRAAAERRLR